MSVDPLHTQHQRRFQERRFVYPVLSRRSNGISIGINLNPDKVCNFGCVYCQVDRVAQVETRFVDLPQLLDELNETIDLVSSGRIWDTDKFQTTPAELRRWNDVAFSGDGEPTTHRNFDQVVEACLQVQERHAATDVPLVLITNASMFHRDHVQHALRLLDQSDGQIWAKLDAGTESYFKSICRTPFSLQQILDNILLAARSQSLVIQSLFLRAEGEPPDDAEIDAYIGRLTDIITCGGTIRNVQIYTVARPTSEDWATALSDDQVDSIVQRVRLATGLRVDGYYGL